MSVLEKYFVGVDVGTGSARAALLSTDGKVLRSHVKPTQTWNPLPDHYEQSSEAIWTAVCECVKSVIEGIRPAQVLGLGFDATCSLVALDKHDQPITVSTTGQQQQNIVLWMDHRATQEADYINATEHSLLENFGGRISPETQPPKMLWIKRNMPDTWKVVANFMDLPDFLTFQSTGSKARSLCSAVGKFNYDAPNECWSTDYFDRIDLHELTENNFAIIGNEVLAPGTPVGNGLSAQAAKQLGLLAGTPVGASLVDAYAGGLSLFGCTGDGISSDIHSKMALICGTSTCHMSIFDQAIWVSGAWGPFKSVLFPQQYVHAAGQSITGILLDFIVKSHPAYAEMVTQAVDEHAHTFLNRRLAEIACRQKLDNLHELTRDIHVWPDYHGNRSPLADPSMRGMISGLSMSTEVDQLAILYLAFMQALAYGTRHILDSMRRHGRPEFASLIICGGLSKNTLFVQTLAEACGMPVLYPNESEMVLVGAAILAARAANFHTSLLTASKAMGGLATVIRPRNGCTEYHDRKYDVFLKMMTDQLAYRFIMN